MDWIAAILKDGKAELYKRIMPDDAVRRIALWGQERYTAIIHMDKSGRRANFVTAYSVDSDVALQKMRGNPAW